AQPSGQLLLFVFPVLALLLEIIDGTEKTRLLDRTPELLAPPGLMPVLTGGEAAVGEMGQAALAQMGEGELSDLAVVGQHSRKRPIGQGAGHVDHRQADRLESCCLLAGHYAGQDAVSPPTVQPARRQEL